MKALGGGLAHTEPGIMPKYSNREVLRKQREWTTRFDKGTRSAVNDRQRNVGGGFVSSQVVSQIEFCKGDERQATHANTPRVWVKG